MQIQQTGQFVLGIILGEGGLFILCGSLYALWKTKKFKDNAERELLASGILFILLGAGHLSRAFDLPHYDSTRTNLIYAVSLPLAIPLIGYVFYLRRKTRAKANRQHT